MDLLSFLPPFFGVLVAFLIQRGWSWIEDRRARKKLLQSVRKELEASSERLVGEGNLLPTDVWKSAVSSGSLKLIPQDRKTELVRIYFRVECHNYEAEKVRDVGILAATDKKKARPENQWFFQILRNFTLPFRTGSENQNQLCERILMDFLNRANGAEFPAQ